MTAREAAIYALTMAPTAREGNDALQRSIDAQKAEHTMTTFAFRWHTMEVAHSRAPRCSIGDLHPIANCLEFGDDREKERCSERNAAGHRCERTAGHSGPHRDEVRGTSREWYNSPAEPTQ